MMQFCDVVWNGLFITRWLGRTAWCIACSQLLTPFWLYVRRACKNRKERERDLNGQVIEHNITCYGNDIHVCVLFVLCVVYLVVNHLLLHYIKTIFWSVVRPVFFSCVDILLNWIPLIDGEPPTLMRKV